MKRTLKLLLLSLCGIGAAVGPAPANVDRAPAAPEAAPRHYDARVEFNKGFRAARPRRAPEAVRSLAGEVTDLAVDYDETTATVRSLSNHVGYLTPARPGVDALAVATQYLQANVEVLGLEDADLVDYEVTDRVFSRATGATHLYLRQTHRGLPVYNAQLHVNVNREGRLISVNNSFLPGLARLAGDIDPALDLGRAVLKAAHHLGIAAAVAPRERGAPEGLAQATVVDHRGISRQPIRGRLMWLPIRAGMARLVWNFQIHTADRQHIYDMTVDAADGRVWTRFDWVSGDSYRVYARPAESPSHVSPAPPADGRTLVSNPANALASPFGWHDTNGAAGAEFTVTQGNNVEAYTDTDNNNSPDAGSSPSGGAGLNFDFALDLTLAPSAYRPAAVTNLFYWNNVIHDVQYQYGFDEAAGNFQVNNYGRGGAGNDSVRAEAQDGGGTNNANFATPPDGSRPRMQMYVWTAPTPDRDGDVDNGIVIHEYGHGISNRLVGGPSNVSCLTNNQQPGEGLSDWWSLAYTHEPGDAGTDARGIGTYALGQPTSGAGIRTQRYSTSPSVNTWTYASISGMAIPHGVGSVWAQGAWEVYWKLVDAHGFDPNLYNAAGNAGNQRMMLYVNEGLKNTACNPTFTQVRDGILQAAADNHGGEDVCRMWEAFAAFGLGTNAVSGGANSTSPTNGFNIPASCQTGNQPPVANAGPDQSVSVGTLVTLTGAGSSDPDGGPSPLGYSWAQLSGPSVTLGTPTSVNATFSPTVAGTYAFRLTVSDGAATDTDDVTVNVTGGGGGGGQAAVFDAVLQAPRCSTVGSSCDTGSSLVLGRDGRGPEPNQPNTIADSCADGTSGTFHADESNDRLVVSTTDGASFAAGKTVRVDATVWAWSTPSADRLDLYYAADATSPAWTLIATLTPTVAGQQTLSATYTLPSGALQAVRAQFRYQGSASTCTSGGYNDRDDLVFAVTSTAPVTVFEDTFETDKGWTVNPSATDTATTGLWERGDPEQTTSSGVKQLGTTVSGANDLVTGRLAGAGAGSHDIDGGVTSIRSPAIALPASGSLSLSFSYYLAHGTNSSTADFLRVSVVGATTAVVFQEQGAANNDDAAWASTSVGLNAFAGQTVRILVEAADASTASLVEAAIDDVRVTQQ
ncbi:MAG TPA: M36 family metallopeptidase [Vicinamibacteria bacterium]